MRLGRPRPPILERGVYGVLTPRRNLASWVGPILLAVCALLLGGCDPGYSYAVWNETTRVIAEARDQVVRTVFVEAGEHAQVASAWGVAEPGWYIEIFTEECEHLGRVDLC